MGKINLPCNLHEVPVDLKITDIWQQNLIHLFLTSCVLSDDYATLVLSIQFNDKCPRAMQKMLIRLPNV